MHAEFQQRLFGVLPNFYVVYSHEPAPLSTKLKYQLAMRASLDPTNLVAAAFLGAINQASDFPAYHQGWKGYGQRVGAVYADDLTDIFFGGAVLPSLLRQDPRYYYSGEGTKKARVLHAIATPFICKGDNGQREFNYSSIGGDLISASLSNIYYPPVDRSVGLVFQNSAVATGGRIMNALAQEFLLRRFTTKQKVIQ